MIPMLTPRPPDGLVQAQASPTAANPVATGTPSTTNYWYGPRRHLRRGVRIAPLAALLGLPTVQLPRPHRRPPVRHQDRGLLLRPAMAQHRHVLRPVPAAGGRARADADPARRSRPSSRPRQDPAVVLVPRVRQ